MTLQQLQDLLQQAYPQAKVTVQGDGSHFFITLVDDYFQDLSLIKRQRDVYSHLQSYIDSGELHAVSMSIKTTHEANKET